jgi:hypothetical protein
MPLHFRRPHVRRSTTAFGKDKQPAYIGFGSPLHRTTPSSLPSTNLYRERMDEARSWGLCTPSSSKHPARVEGSTEGVIDGAFPCSSMLIPCVSNLMPLRGSAATGDCKCSLPRPLRDPGSSQSKRNIVLLL